MSSQSLGLPGVDETPNQASAIGETIDFQTRAATPVVFDPEVAFEPTPDQGGLLAESGPVHVTGDDDETPNVEEPVEKPAEYVAALVESVTKPAPAEVLTDEDPEPVVVPGLADLVSREPVFFDEPEAEAAPVVEPAAPAVAPVVEAAPAPAKKESKFALLRRHLGKVFVLLNPNTNFGMVAALLLLGTVLFGSIGASVTNVYAMAAWIGLPVQVQWLPVLILDVAIVGYSWALMVRSSRLREGRHKLFGGEFWSNDVPLRDLSPKQLKKMRERTFRTRAMLFFVTAMAVVANGMHTWDFWGGKVDTPQAMIGLIFSASIPLWALAATEELIKLAFTRDFDAYKDKQEEDAR